MNDKALLQELLKDLQQTLDHYRAHQKSKPQKNRRAYVQDLINWMDMEKEYRYDLMVASGELFMWLLQGGEDDHGLDNLLN